jgi:hypothetical protein
MLKQSLFGKHDFAVWVHQIYHDYQNLYFWQWRNYSNNFHLHTKEEYSDKSTRFNYYGGGKYLIFSSDELRLYVSVDLYEQQYQFLWYVKKDDKSNIELNDGDILCNVPLNILVLKLTLKSAKELANLHDLYMPSKILLKNAQILLKHHKCETCPDILAILNPVKQLLMLNINRLGIKKIKRNMLNMINSVL